MLGSKIFKACKNCQERYPGCHDHCEKGYKEERAEYDRRKAIADKDKSVRQYLYEEHKKYADKKAQEKKQKAGYRHM